MLYNKNNLAVVKIASKKSYNSVLTGVLFAKDKTVATDSFMLCEVTVPKDQKIEEFPAGETAILQDTEPFIVNGDGIRAIKLPSGKASKNLPVLENLAIREVADNTVQFFTTDLVSSNSPRINRIIGDFPDYEPLWPTGEIKAEIRLDANKLRSLLEVLAGLDKFGYVDIKLYADGLPMVITAGTDNQSGRAMLMPVKK
jgi:DNA polymerase III sliding clamp (beta) subunit (PCNA family)